MAVDPELKSAVILRTQIVNDLKNGIAKGVGAAFGTPVGFEHAMAELTRLGVKALRKYVGETK